MSPPPKDQPSELIGARLPRREDPRLLTGNGRFLADHHVLDGLHACFVRSEHAHADLLRVDAQAARALPGVYAVLTATDLPLTSLANPRHPLLIATEQPVLARDRLRFVGESVALVIATDRYVAEDAAELISVEAATRSVAVNARDSPASDAWLFDEAAPENIVFHEVRTFGDPDEVFASAAATVSRTLSFGRQSASPLECRGCIASYDPDAKRLTVWASTQSPHAMRGKLAAVTGLAEHQIEVRIHDIGGAFGQKIPLHPEEAAVALAAVHLGTTITWIEDRRENLLAAPHARAGEATLELALAEDGRFLAMRAVVLGDAGAYSFNAGSALSEPYLTARSMLGGYRVAHYRYEATARVTNKPPIAPYRGVGYVNAQIIRELAIDDAARALDIDRVELRRRNLVRDEDFPYTNAIGMIYDSGSYLGCLDDVVARLAAEPATAPLSIASPADVPARTFGVGFSVFVEPTAPGSKLVEQVWDTPSREGDDVRVSLGPSGAATVSFGTPSIGQGIETAMAQVVADVLHLDMDQVAVELGSTTFAPVSLTGTRGSRSAVITGGAAAAAAFELHETLRAVAAAALEASLDDVRIEHGRAYVRGTEANALSVRQLVDLAMTSPRIRSELGEISLSVTKPFDPAGATYSNGCVGAVVSVHPITGGTQLERLVIAHDCGTVINPAIVDGQIVGAAAQGWGAATLEVLEFDEAGQPLSTSLMDYRLPTSTDTVTVELLHRESPSPHTWRGVKGAGEAGTIGTTAAVVCAIADALGPMAASLAAVPARPPELAALFARGGLPETVDVEHSVQQCTCD